jgi:hypothetical protein
MGKFIAELPFKSSQSRQAEKSSCPRKVRRSSGTSRHRCPCFSKRTSGGQKMSFPNIQYHFHTVLMYVRIFSISYCILLSKNTVVQNPELRKIQLYRTIHCEIVMLFDSARDGRKSKSYLQSTKSRKQGSSQKNHAAINQITNK